MSNDTKTRLKQIIDKIGNHIDSKCEYDVCGQAIKCGWSSKEVHHFAKKLWDLGITDGIDNDADHWKHEDINDVNSDLDTAYESVGDGSFNGSFADNVA